MRIYFVFLFYTNLLRITSNLNYFNPNLQNLKACLLKINNNVYRICFFNRPLTMLVSKMTKVKKEVTTSLEHNCKHNEVTLKIQNLQNPQLVNSI